MLCLFSHLCIFVVYVFRRIFVRKWLENTYTSATGSSSLRGVVSQRSHILMIESLRHWFGFSFSASSRLMTSVSYLNLSNKALSKYSDKCGSCLKLLSGWISVNSLHKQSQPRKLAEVVRNGSVKQCSLPATNGWYVCTLLAITFIPES